MVLELQERRKCRAEDLAAIFEISKRTVYRDIQALCEAGVPIIGEAGEGYSLAEGYFLPPLSFTADEGAMLLLGSDVMAQSFDAEYRAAAQAAGRKIAGVLPDRLREEVEHLRTSIRFITPSALANGEQERTLQQLRRAIFKHQTVRFNYFARRGENSVRDADPYALIHVMGAWLLVAYCHTRKDVRTFRLSRIEKLVVQPRLFTIRPDFDMKKHFAKHQEIAPSERLVARVLFDHEIARWVKESYTFFLIGSEETADGLVLTFGLREERDILQWVLGWGRHARVLEPESLRRMVAEEAKAMTRVYAEH